MIFFNTIVELNFVSGIFLFLKMLEFL